MEIIKDWTAVLVLTSVIGTIVLILSPSGSIEKQVKTAVAIVMLAVIVSPFLSGLKSENKLEIKYEDYDEETLNYEDQFVLSFEKTLSNEILTLLNTNGIQVKDIRIEANSDNGNVSIEKVVVCIDENNEYDKSKILKLIQDKYGIIAETEVVS